VEEEPKADKWRLHFQMPTAQHTQDGPKDFAIADSTYIVPARDAMTVKWWSAIPSRNVIDLIDDIPPPLLKTKTFKTLNI
jgi:hypothetical protein